MCIYLNAYLQRHLIIKDILLVLTRPQSSLMRKLEDAKDDGKEKKGDWGRVSYCTIPFTKTRRTHPPKPRASTGTREGRKMGTRKMRKMRGGGATSFLPVPLPVKALGFRGCDSNWHKPRSFIICLCLYYSLQNTTKPVWNWVLISDLYRALPRYCYRFSLLSKGWYKSTEAKNITRWTAKGLSDCVLCYLYI